MSVLFPPRLAPGDVIGVTAPSAGVPEHLHPRLELAIKKPKEKRLPGPRRTLLTLAAQK